MLTGLTRLIRIHINSNTWSRITSKTIKKIVQEHCHRAQKSKRSSVSSESKSSGSINSMKEQAIKQKMRRADLMAETFCMKQRKLQELATEELKIKMETKQAKARVKIMEGEEQKFGEMAKNQEDLGI